MLAYFTRFITFHGAYTFSSVFFTPRVFILDIRNTLWLQVEILLQEDATGTEVL